MRWSCCRAREQNPGKNGCTKLCDSCNEEWGTFPVSNCMIVKSPDINLPNDILDQIVKNQHELIDDLEVLLVEEEELDKNMSTLFCC